MNINECAECIARLRSERAELLVELMHHMLPDQIPYLRRMPDEDREAIFLAWRWAAWLETLLRVDGDAYDAHGMALRELGLMHKECDDE